VLREACRDRHLGAGPVLAVADALCDVRRERLRLERLAEDDLVDRLVDDLLEARHVRALLARSEVDEALELGVEELFLTGGPDPHDLLDAGHADPRQAHVGAGPPGLDVLFEQRRGVMWITAHCGGMTIRERRSRDPHDRVYSGRRLDVGAFLARNSAPRGSRRGREKN
jgi:hypothetical protein